MKKILLFIGSVLCQEDIKGGCPNITGAWDDSVRGILKLDKLVGPWRNIYDHMHDSQEQRCLSIKLEQLAENPLLLNMSQGAWQTWDRDLEYEHPEHGVYRMVYDDTVVLNFSKSNESAVAAVGQKDFNDFDDINAIYNAYNIPELSPEELADMSPEEIKDYEDTKQAIAEYKVTMKETLE